MDGYPALFRPGIALRKLPVNRLNVVGHHPRCFMLVLGAVIALSSVQCSRIVGRRPLYGHGQRLLLPTSWDRDAPVVGLIPGAVLVVLVSLSSPLRMLAASMVRGGR